MGTWREVRNFAWHRYDIHSAQWRAEGGRTGRRSWASTAGGHPM